MQLTWPDNYIKYWRFRGRQVDPALAETLHQAAVAANTNGSNAGLMTADMQVPASMKVWRKSLGGEPFDATDSAGAYWAWAGAALNADQTPALQRETEPVESTQKPYYRCQSFGLVTATVNVGHPSVLSHQWPSGPLSGIYGRTGPINGRHAVSAGQRHVSIFA